MNDFGKIAEKLASRRGTSSEPLAAKDHAFDKAFRSMLRYPTATLICYVSGVTAISLAGVVLAIMSGFVPSGLFRSVPYDRPIATGPFLYAVLAFQVVLAVAAWCFMHWLRRLEPLRSRRPLLPDDETGTGGRPRNLT